MARVKEILHKGEDATISRAFQRSCDFEVALLNRAAHKWHRAGGNWQCPQDLSECILSFVGGVGDLL